MWAGYWLLVTALLLFYPVLQTWDASPESFTTAPMLAGLSVVVLGVAAASFRRPKLHFSLVVGLLFVGGCIYARNQGIWNERADAHDLLVIERAQEIFASSESWDRAESRDCSDASDAPGYTLYCGLRRASLDVSGRFRHRRPALQVVRRQIELQRPDTVYGHRIGGYNADPDVTLEDLHALLDASKREIEAEVLR